MNIYFLCISKLPCVGARVDWTSKYISVLVALVGRVIQDHQMSTQTDGKRINQKVRCHNSRSSCDNVSDRQAAFASVVLQAYSYTQSRSFKSRVSHRVSHRRVVWGVWILIKK